jgi:chemosensory pili system protein ChpA (sensor histidine kinase/response regulator)
MSMELDIGPLSWVKGEIDLALERASAALSAPAGNELAAAGNHLHQAHGALMIVGMEGITQFSEALERVFAALTAGRLADVERAIAAAQTGIATLRSYLDGLMAGEPNQPLKLYPAYSGLLTACGEADPGAVALFFPDLTQRPPKRDVDTPPPTGDALIARLKMARMAFERGLLKWIKGDAKGISEMRLAVTMIEATRVQPADRAFWWITLAFYSALAAGLLPDAVAAKKLALKIGAQIKKLTEGQVAVPDRLLAEALYQVGTAKPVPADSPEPLQLVELVRSAYRLADLIPRSSTADAEALRPQVRRLRDVCAGAKDDWNKLCIGSAAALPPFHEKVSQLAELGRVLEQDDLTRLLTALTTLANGLRRDPSRHNEAMALEVATALLLIDNALENFEAIHGADAGQTDFSHQVDVVSQRLQAVMAGDALGELDLPHLDAMSRRAQERLLLASVAREISSNLVQIEQALDSYFRDPGKTEGRTALGNLARPLKQVEGALAVLGHDRACAVLGACETQIAELAAQGGSDKTVFEDLASKLSALGFFVEQLELGAQPDIDTILDPQRKAPEPLVEIPAEVPAEVPLPVASVEEVPSVDSAASPEPTFHEPVADVPEVHEEADIDIPLAELELEPEPAPPPVPEIAPPVPSAESARLADASADEVDAELLGIFLEEANEVLATIADSLPRVHATPSDSATLTTLRRSFHTFKGSGRMVGLHDLGESAWGVEQVLNKWLQLAQPASPALLAMLDLAADVFGAWTRALAAGQLAHPDPAPLAAQCALLLAGDEAVTADAEPVVETVVEAESEPEIEPVATPSAEVLAFPTPPPVMIGELAISPTLYALFSEEARGHLATIQADIGRDDVPGSALIRAAHTLGSIAGTTGILAIHHLARALEHALDRLANTAVAPTDEQRFTFARTAGALEGMLGAVANRRLPGDEIELTQTLESLQPQLPSPAPAVEPVEAVEPIEPMQAIEPLEFAEPAITLPIETPPPIVATMASSAPAVAPETLESLEERRARRMGDEIDAQLLPLFLEESVDLMRAIGEDLRDWRAAPDNNTIAQRLQRELHTLKGSARMTGAMGCGELLHSMESRIEQAVAMKAVSAEMLDSLETSYDRAAFLIERLRRGEFISAEMAPTPSTTDDVRIETAAESLSDSTPDSADSAPTAVAEEMSVAAASATAAARVPQIQQTHLRVRADLVDRLVNEAGEVAIARGRMEGEMRALKASLLELTENVIRLRGQVREIEIQAETQMQAQMSQLRAKAEQDGTQFDPLELDRFTRFQELTRMMAESVNDVSTVQHSLLKNLDSTNASLAAQARLNRELSQRLMSVRMVPFETLAERLHRVVRQAAKDCGKRANLDIRGGQTGVDRSVLERIGAPLEHLLRNSVAHGIESPAGRDAAGKDALGQITVSLAQEGNEVVIAIADDGKGLDFKRIRARALERGLIAADSSSDERELSALIFNSGFSTAEVVTATSGRGVGMDVVKNEIEGLGGRIEISTTPGQGSNFRLYLPLTLAVSQAVIIQSGGLSYALPSSMIEQASELKPDAIAKIRLEGGTEWLGRHYDWHYLPRLLGDAGAQPIPARRHWLLLVKGGSERAAIEIDGLVNNQEIVIKAIGPQLARVPGVSGATVLGDGEIALILNPIALVARAAARHAAAVAAHQTETVAPGLSDTQIQRHMAPQGCVMVVDDSLTVRKITGRLLGRQGYHVLTAKDGVDALEQLTEVRPDVMLVDIEMPRMDGFEFSRNVRADPRLRSIPIIMISSRTADKHREYAQEIGVDHYLGKPYDEDRLLALVAGYTAHALNGKGNPP